MIWKFLRNLELQNHPYNWPEKDTSKKISGRQDIVKETKKKPEPPTRALNDPRDN